jgi:hypothetical protein
MHPVLHEAVALTPQRVLVTQLLATEPTTGGWSSKAPSLPFAHGDSGCDPISLQRAHAWTIQLEFDESSPCLAWWPDTANAQARRRAPSVAISPRIAADEMLELAKSRCAAGTMQCSGDDPVATLSSSSTDALAVAVLW